MQLASEGRVSTGTQENLDPAAALAKAVINTSSQLGLTQADLAAVLGMDRTAINRLTALDPASKQGEIAILLVRISRVLSDLTGEDNDWIAHFMSSPNTVTKGVPAEQIKSIVGLREVLKCVEALQSKS